MRKAVAEVEATLTEEMELVVGGVVPAEEPTETQTEDVSDDKLGGS